MQRVHCRALRTARRHAQPASQKQQVAVVTAAIVAAVAGLKPSLRAQQVGDAHEAHALEPCELLPRPPRFRRAVVSAVHAPPGTGFRGRSAS